MSAFRQGANQCITPRNDFAHFETKKSHPAGVLCPKSDQNRPPVLLGISQWFVRIMCPSLNRFARCCSAGFGSYTPPIRCCSAGWKNLSADRLNPRSEIRGTMVWLVWTILIMSTCTNSHRYSLQHECLKFVEGVLCCIANSVWTMTDYGGNYFSKLKSASFHQL